MQLNWLRAEVFQLNLKYLHVKYSYRTVVKKIMKSSYRASYENMAERFPDFEIREIRELKENAQNQKLEKVNRPGSTSGPVNCKHNTF